MKKCILTVVVLSLLSSPARGGDDFVKSVGVGGVTALACYAITKKGNESLGCGVAVGALYWLYRSVVRDVRDTATDLQEKVNETAKTLQNTYNRTVGKWEPMVDVAQDLQKRGLWSILTGRNIGLASFYQKRQKGFFAVLNLATEDVDMRPMRIEVVSATWGRDDKVRDVTDRVRYLLELVYSNVDGQSFAEDRVRRNSDGHVSIEYANIVDKFNAFPKLDKHVFNNFFEVVFRIRCGDGLMPYGSSGQTEFRSGPIKVAPGNHYYQFDPSPLYFNTLWLAK